MTTSRFFNPADYPDRKGPRPPELIDDPLEVQHDEQAEAVTRASEEFARLSAIAEAHPCGLQRAPGAL